jgi:hypothetical protein
MPLQKSASAHPSPLEEIPPQEVIRDRLTNLFAEAKLLRKLLRLSERRDRMRVQARQRGGTDHVPA